MTSSNGEGRFSLSNMLNTAGVALCGLAALGAVGTTGTWLVNGRQSAAEFNNVAASVRMLAEQGKLSDSRGAPAPYVVKANGQEYAISVSSAMVTRNGAYRDASGQVVAQDATTAGDGAIRSEMQVSGYQLQGVISRIKGSDSWLRPFFDDGGSRSFSEGWSGYKPPHAPLSGGIAVTPAVVAAPAAPAAPAPAAAPAG